MVTDAPPSRAGACPPAETVAAYVEGRLAAAARPAVATHLGGCFLCRAVALGLAKAKGLSADAAGIPASGTARPAPAPPTGPASPTPGPRTPAEATPPPGTAGPAPRPAPAATGPRVPRGLLLVVALLVVAGVAWLLLRPKGGGGAAAGPDGDVVLARVVPALAAAHPDLFAGFTPVSADERLAATAPTPDPDAPGPRGPVGTVLGGTPTFSWAAVGRVRTYDVTLRGGDGKPAWKRHVEGLELPFPADAAPLPPGSAWTWEVACKRTTEGADGKRSTTTVRATRAFRVASAADRARFEAAAAAARARPAADRPDLVVAHLALRSALLDEAERAAARDAAAHPGDAAAATTVRYVRARLAGG